MSKDTPPRSETIKAAELPPTEAATSSEEKPSDEMAKGKLVREQAPRGVIIFRVIALLLITIFIFLCWSTVTNNGNGFIAYMFGVVASALFLVFLLSYVDWENLDTEEKKPLGNQRHATPEDLKKHEVLSDSATDEAGVLPFPYVGLTEKNRCLLYKENCGLVTIGPPGSGKTTGLFIPNLSGLDRSILVIDPKGELASITAERRREFGRVVVLDPFGKVAGGESAGFNPLANLNPESPRFVPDAMALAEGLVRIRGHDPHWSEGGQDFVAALIMFVRHKYGKAATLGHVRHLLTLPRKGKDGENNLLFTIAEMIESDFPPVRQKAGRFATMTDEMGSIVSAAVSQTRFLDTPAIADDLAKDSGFDFAMMRRETVTVYLVLPLEEVGQHANWLRLIVAAALRALMKDTGDGSRPSVLFLLDEFAQLGHLSEIENAMAAVRGLNIQIWPILQDLTQLKALYADRWETFLGTAGMITTFGPNDMTTAEYFSRRSGVTQVDIKHSGASNASTVPHSVPLFRPEDLLGYPAGETLCFKRGLSHPIKAKVPLYKKLDWCKV